MVEYLLKVKKIPISEIYIGKFLTPAKRICQFLHHLKEDLSHKKGDHEGISDIEVLYLQEAEFSLKSIHGHNIYQH